MTNKPIFPVSSQKDLALPKLPSDVSGQEALAAFKRLGFTFVRQKGSHMFIRRPGPEENDVTTIPDHSTLAKGTLRSVLKQANVGIEDFLNNL